MIPTQCHKAGFSAVLTSYDSLDAHPAIPMPGSWEHVAEHLTLRPQGANMPTLMTQRIPEVHRTYPKKCRLDNGEKKIDSPENDSGFLEARGKCFGDRPRHFRLEELLAADSQKWKNRYK